MKRCWDQDPRLRPEVSEVSRIFPSSSSILDEIRSLYKPGMASHEFQLALGRLYGSPNYRDRIDSLRDIDLREFIDFLDNV